MSIPGITIQFVSSFGPWLELKKARASSTRGSVEPSPILGRRASLLKKRDSKLPLEKPKNKSTVPAPLGKTRAESSSQTSNFWPSELGQKKDHFNFIRSKLKPWVSTCQPAQLDLLTFLSNPLRRFACCPAASSQVQILNELLGKKSLMICQPLNSAPVNY